MKGYLTDSRADLIRQMPFSERGPKKNGVFALWILVSVCEGLLGPNCVSEKNHLRRVAALKRRLSSLSLPPELRRVVPSALAELGTATGVSAARALSLLVAPTIETIGKDCGEIIAGAAARAAMRPATDENPR